MKLNYETCIVGQRCILVPYRPQHVEIYHTWMQDAHLLEATGSEPLTIQEEYEMQSSWRLDETKCTFIVLARHLLSSTSKLLPTIDEEATNSDNHNDVDHENDNDNVDSDSFIIENLQAMVGDVNLFLSIRDDDEEDDDDDAASKGDEITSHSRSEDTPLSRIQAELDIMIAESSCRQMGIGRETVCLMMLYGIRHLNITRFFCKINQDNTASRSLFAGDGNNTTLSSTSTSSLGFEQCGYAECFGQYEYELERENVKELECIVTALLGTTKLHTFSCPIGPTATTT